MQKIALIIILLCPSLALAEKPAKTSFSNARLQLLNKVTARVTEITVSSGLPASFGSIDLDVRSCWKSPQDERPEHAALIEIREHQAESAQTKLIFSGWMFASSPAISALEHPVYDVTLLACEK